MLHHTPAHRARNINPSHDQLPSRAAITFTVTSSSLYNHHSCFLMTSEIRCFHKATHYKSDSTDLITKISTKHFTLHSCIKSVSKAQHLLLIDSMFSYLGKRPSWKISNQLSRKKWHLGGSYHFMSTHPIAAGQSAHFIIRLTDT